MFTCQRAHSRLIGQCQGTHHGTGHTRQRKKKKFCMLDFQHRGCEASQRQRRLFVGQPSYSGTTVNVEPGIRPTHVSVMR